MGDRNLLCFFSIFGLSGLNSLGNLNEENRRFVRGSECLGYRQLKYRISTVFGSEMHIHGSRRCETAFRKQLQLLLFMLYAPMARYHLGVWSLVYDN